MSQKITKTIATDKKLKKCQIDKTMVKVDNLFKKWKKAKTSEKYRT